MAALDFAVGTFVSYDSGASGTARGLDILADEKQREILQCPPHRREKYARGSHKQNAKLKDLRTSLTGKFANPPRADTVEDAAHISLPLRVFVYAASFATVAK